MTSNSPLHYALVTQPSYLHCIQRPQHLNLSSQYFSEGYFQNEYPPEVALSKLKVTKWLLSRRGKSWPACDDVEQVMVNRSKAPIIDQASDTKAWRIWYVNHSTVLIQMGKFNIITDPIWANFAGPKQGVGPRRTCLAGIALEHLPRIDAVLLSHNHYDHMDLATLTWLQNRFKMPIYTGLGNAFYLPKTWQVIELDWWQSTRFLDFELTYTPAQHGSGRGILDQNKALWGSFCLHYQGDYLYFAADTGYCPQFKTLYSRFGSPRLALLPIGAYEPRALMKYVHMNPEEAVQAHLDLQARHSIAIHHRTFQLTDEPRNEPVTRLKNAIRQHTVEMPFDTLVEGESVLV